MVDESAEKYVIKQGDCISSIAEEKRFLFETIWNYSGNSELRKLRKDPNILLPGDVLMIPPRGVKEYSCPTEKKHSFVKKADKTKLSLRLLQEGKPRANVSFKVSVGNFSEKGTTDGEGFINVQIPSKATNGKLSILNKDEIVEEYNLDLGYLDPLDEINGIQKRLKNLGFECEESGVLDEQTKAAISAFRAKHKLKGEEIDDKFKTKLKEIHGS